MGPDERKEVFVKFSSLRRSDVQSKCALVLALASLVPFFVAAGLLLRNFRRDVGQIVYGSEGTFLPLFLSCLALASAPSALAFVFGWSSSGHRRNDRPGRSWFGFFVGGAVFTLCIIMAMAFVMLRLKKPT